MKQGFTLVEVLIATALASIISVTLLLMWRNMNQLRTRIDRVIDVHERVVRVYNQLDRDLAGAFLPVEADKNQAAGGSQETATQSMPKENQQATNVKPPIKETTAPVVTKKLEKVFWGDQNLSELTFVTNNIMQRYWSAKLARAGTPQPRIARIIYRLVPDKKHPDSFILTRQEAAQLSLVDISEKTARAYAIADHIRTIRMQYGVYVKIPKEKGGDVAFERKVVSEWKKIEEQKPPWPLIPEWITMDIEFWDDRYQHVYPYHFEFRILSHTQEQKSAQPEAKPPVLPGMQTKKPVVRSASMPTARRGISGTNVGVQRENRGSMTSAWQHSLALPSLEISSIDITGRGNAS